VSNFNKILNLWINNKISRLEFIEAIEWELNNCVLLREEPEEEKEMIKEYWLNRHWELDKPVWLKEK
jgi:hypothetical protein